MSICLTWFPIGGLGKPKLYQNMWCFSISGDLLGDVTVGESLDGENAPNPTTESRFHLPANTQREIL